MLLSTGGFSETQHFPPTQNHQMEMEMEIFIHKICCGKMKGFFFLDFLFRPENMAFNILIFFCIGFCCLINNSLAYYSDLPKDHYLSDSLLRDIVDAVGKDFVDDTDYMDTLPVSHRLALMARASKDLEAEQMMDYEGLLEGNPNPSLRDQEYLQHSSLWGHQYVSGGAGEGESARKYQQRSMASQYSILGPHQIKPQVKTDASLPAYCNPPNPCPVGYNEDQGCTLDFENTASFSREYQAAQECMCDAEHMFECSNGQDSSDNGEQNFQKFLAQQFHAPAEHKNLVAKKFFTKKVSYLQ